MFKKSASLNCLTGVFGHYCARKFEMQVCIAEYFELLADRVDS